MNICKFCGFEWDYANPCEYWSDPETGEVQYCGNQECPACTFCQGNESSEDTIRSAANIRAIREHRPVTWL